MVTALALLLVLARPPSALSQPSARGFPLLVHGPAGSATLVARVVDAADRSWQAEMVEGLWPAPPADTAGPDSRFDIYVDESMSFPEAYVVGEASVAATSWYDQTSYMVLPGDFPNDAALFSTVAHELNHASQYALDAAEDDAFFEHTAVLVEEKVARDFATYGAGVRDYQGHAERALTYLGTDWYEYGAGLWLMFLSERLDGGGYGLVQRLWRDSQQSGTSNHPHFLDALDGVLRAQGWTRRRFFSTLSAWRYFTGPRDDGRHFRVGAEWGASSLIPASAQALGASPLHVDAMLAGFGTKLFELTVPLDAATVTATVDGAETGLALVPLSASGAALEDGAVTAGTELTVRLELPPGTAKVLAALTSTPADYDPSRKPFAVKPVSADLTVELAAGADAGADRDAGIESPPPPRGCGCDAGGAGGAASGWLALVALVVLARARAPQWQSPLPHG